MKTSLPLRSWRCARLILHFLLGLFEVGLLFPLRSSKVREAAIQRWSRRLCTILAIHIQTHGAAPTHRPHNTLLVANHVSWLDIFVLNSVFPARFVAKAEVRHWPLIGWLCAQTGTLFITRERRHDTRRVNKQIAHALQDGDCIAVFPEGGTSDGMSTRAFNASLLQPAVESHAHIQAVAINYYDQHGARSLAAAYIDDMSLWTSLTRLMAEPSLQVRLDYFPRLAAATSSRRELAMQAEQWIAARVALDAPSTALEDAVKPESETTAHHPDAAH